MEIELIHCLATNVVGLGNAILTASEAAGELDSLIALAIGADKYRWNAPRMTTRNIINIRDGRHPLQELVLPAFVSNDCGLTGGPGTVAETVDWSDAALQLEAQPSMLVLTGPNHSGKSIFVKQVALIVYLAHIGSYVPAGMAHVGITDKILTRISTRESISGNESAFAIDLRQVLLATKYATRRSLVLIDEFGKGTRPDDGAGLMVSLLNHFSSLGNDNPKLLATTHFHEILEQDFQSLTRGIYFAHMKIQVELEQPELERQVTYLYKAVTGISRSSFGSQCAAINRVEPGVIGRIEDIALLLDSNEDLGIGSAELARYDKALLHSAEATARNFLEMDMDRLRKIAGSASKQGGSGTGVRVALRELLDHSGHGM